MRRMLLLTLLLAVATGGCIVRVRDTRVQAHDVPLQPVVIMSPVRAHLRDGSVVTFPGGVSITAAAVLGAGRRHDLTRTQVREVTTVPLDSVVAFESFRGGTNEAASFALSVLGTAAGAVGAAALAVAIFGSCPTIYADSAGTSLLQAESFSYSIAPLFEMRDVDVVRARADDAGIVWLEVRNEALETHYLNHMELLAVPHRAEEHVLPDEQGRPLIFGAVQEPLRARDAVGRDVRDVLAARDSSWYETSNARLERRRDVAFSDHVDLEFTVPPGRDSIALVLDLRNSLFNTVLFYDIMLASAGAQALDWLGRTLEEIGEAAHVGRWYSERSGVRISVVRDGVYEVVARVPDAGPIAWKSLAVSLPAHGADNIQVRLEFLADSWRIDRVGLALDARRGTPRALPVTRLVHAEAAHDTAAIDRLHEPDGDYLITWPGASMRVGFDAPALQHADDVLTYLVAAQGYYTEWVRADWVRGAEPPERFAPGDAALERAYRRWLDKRAQFEADFFTHRVPVRQP